MNNALSIIIGLVLVLGVGTVVYMQTQGGNEVAQQVEFGTPTVDTMPAPAEDSARDENADQGGDDVAPSTATIPATPTTPSAPTAPAAPAPQSPTAGGYTAAEVAKHSTRESCWSSINGNVYDLTSWIPKHPGGEQGILRICGTDGSARYNGQHGGAAKQLAILTGFKIGVLK